MAKQENNLPLDANLYTEQKPTSKRPNTTLICVVCGDSALGYNFDAISCESCKAFFRRNALRPLDRLKCRGAGNCEITVENRKRCKRCRLEKCFKMGMRKEWILTDEEKQKKRNQLVEKRRLKHSQEPTTVHRHRRRIPVNSRTENSNSDDDSASPQRTTNTNEETSLMTEVDWSKIHRIQTAYTEAIEYNQVFGVPLYPATHSIHTALELIRAPTYLSSLRLITYLKRTEEFFLLDIDDRVTLVKHNLLAAVFMHIVLIYDPVADTYHEHNTQDPVFQGKDWIEILGEDFYHDITATVTKIIRIVEYDRVVVKILLIILIYIKGFCAYDLLNEPSLNNMFVAYNIQNIYLETLYKYCLHQYGSTKTIRLFTNLIGAFFSIQRLSIHLKDLTHEIIDASQLSPLMQSVLQLPDTTASRS
ncbi:unnamed protein product [Adineta ricciae]|uniref:Nuclear receptor domain-containing protein n=1 Tax=Adineta ricciae TaxID=249248 RepID=A0A813ZFJ8_ADIRI|nr:unnamed protein product [Adineta ricciae]